jgi:two-component system sensor histidine kinase/response regulator
MMTIEIPLLVQSQVTGASDESGGPASILLVDDNEQKRFALRAVLAPLGYPIVEADSGIAALRCVAMQEFAVILLDVRMPDMDGFETAAFIRKRQQSEITPIIFITAFRDDDVTQDDHYVQGAVDFIFAPVEPSELRAKVTVFANLFEKTAALASHAADQQASASQWRLLSDAAPIGIFETDSKGRYVYTNPFWSQITGISSADAEDHTWDDFTDLGLEGRAIKRLQTREGEVGERFEIRDTAQNSRFVIITSVPLVDARGGVAGFVGTVADVTIETEADIAIRKARDGAEEGSRMKSDFLANMSHEIRTPMNGVIGLTELLLETALDARQLDYVRSAQSSGQALLSIVNDILDFSKVEAGMLEIHNEQFTLRPVINSVLDLLSASAQLKGLELIEQIDAAVPSEVCGDPGRLRQVLTNLVGNAVKFTHLGEIVVRVSQTDVRDNEATIRFEVSDTGDGISSEKLDLIFQPFVQVDSSTSRKYEGTGLGLAITGKLVDLMGGDCGVSSRLGAGSTFWFTIRVQAEQVSTDDRLSRDADSIGARVLVVDDNPVQRRALSSQLAGWGMDVDTANSGRLGLAMLRTSAEQARPFALALVDYLMPGMDGLEFANTVAADSGLATHLVVMDGVREGADLRKAVDTGICRSLSKPIHSEALLACVRESLDSQAPEVGTRSGAPPGVGSRENDSLGKVLLAEDNVINQKVALAMLSGAGYQVDIVPDGLAAVDACFARSYDAVLMDCQMPGLNGYEATAAIRARETGGRRIPIIALTAGARYEDREECLSAGMDSYLSKPFSKAELVGMVGASIKGEPLQDFEGVTTQPAGAA